MKEFKIILFISWMICPALLWASKIIPQEITSFDRYEQKAIKKRYKTQDKELFSKQQLDIINTEQLAPTIKEIILHNKIRLNEAQELIDFSQDVKDSGLSFVDLEPRIKRYIKNGDRVFSALNKAIERESFHQWKQIQINKVANQYTDFVHSINELNLHAYDHKKIINTFATCVASFRDPVARNTIMKPKICDPIDDYEKPRHKNGNVTVCEIPALEETARVIAYRQLIIEAIKVADQEQLSAFERLRMAKCMAEQSLRFFVPSHHPIRALRKNRAMDKKSPEEAFFMTTGVCGNFSGIAYNIANAIGLKDQIFLATNKLHIYLEMTHDGNWYHAHPFNSKSRCDLTRFQQ